MSDLFATFREAVEEREAGVGRAGRALGVTFRGPVEGSNEHFDVLRAGRSDKVDEVSGAEVRVRRGTRAVRLLSVDVDSRVRCVPEREVEGLFGRPRDIATPRPEQPPLSPIYRLYQRPWGELRIGTAGGCVVAIVAEFVTN